MDHAKKVKVVEGYIAAYNAHDLEAVLAMYAPEATMEDPVGSPPASGREAISALYRTGFEMGITVELDGSIRTVDNAAIFPLCARTSESKLYIIDLFEFDDSEKVVRMRAYWSRDNLVGEMDI